MSKVDVNNVVDSMPKLTKKLNSRNILIIAGAILFVGIIICFILGYVYAGFKSPNQKVVINNSICSNASDIEKLNVYLSDLTNASNTDKAKEAISYIKSKDSYQKDPTCIEALYRFSYISRDFSSLKGYVNSLKDFAESEQYPSNKFNGTNNLYNNTVNIEVVSAGSS